MQRPPTEVGYVTIKTQSVPLHTELPGRTVAALQSDVRPQVSGIILTRNFEEGSVVKAGQRLYQIDPAPYRAALHEAEANLKSAQASVVSTRLTDQRYAGLVKEKGVSQQDADDAHAAYLEAEANVALYKAQVETAQLDLTYTEVKAPITGRIGTSSVTPGALVTADQDTALATITALDPMYVDVSQSSAELLRLRKQMSAGELAKGSTDVSLTLEDGSTYDQEGTLKLSEVSVDTSTGSVLLRAEFPNPDGLLLPGMFVRETVEDAVANNAILAPQRGVTRDAKGEATAMVVGSDGKAEQRILTTDRTVGNQWLVTSGLKVGDKLIVDGLTNLQVGDAVKPVPYQSDDGGGSTATSTATTASGTQTGAGSDSKTEAAK